MVGCPPPRRLACGKENIDAIKAAYNSVKGTIHTFKAGCQPCQQLTAETQEAQEAEDDITALADMATAAQALNAH